MHVYPSRYNQRSLGQLRGASDVNWAPVIAVASIGGAFILLYFTLGAVVAAADRYAPA